MTSDPIDAFLAADPAQQYRMTIDPQHAPALRAYFGAAAYADLAALAQTGLRRRELGSLGPAAPTNLIFVPGIMGSLLRSRTLGGVWWIDALALMPWIAAIAERSGQPDALSEIATAISEVCACWP